MGSLGIGEILLIVFVAFLVFGPQQLPKVLREVGRIIGELQRAAMQAQSIGREEMWKMEQQAAAGESATPDRSASRTVTEPARMTEETGGDESESDEK